jgi:hypothetical protein
MVKDWKNLPHFKDVQMGCKLLQVGSLLNVVFLWLLRAVLDKNKGGYVKPNY